MSITVYSKPNCSQCDATYRTLDRKGLEYSVVDITEDESALELFKELGYVSAPVVTVDQPDGSVKTWSGFRVDEINNLAALVAA